ncbi:MAG: OprO/OprP family phosphate-selective porin [Deltaproteobacteria bacterium]|nr:OprO/OprP family phosphate-selective porin [Deltaproteobacteria bacterium]
MSTPMTNLQRLAVVLSIVSTSAVATAQPAPPPGDPPPTETPPTETPPSDSPPSDASPAPPAVPPSDAPPAAPKKADTPLLVTYDKGIAFTTADKAFKAKLNLRSQLRFDATRPTDPGAEFQNRVLIARARLGIDGNAFGERNRYKLELGLGDKGSFSFVKDLFVEKALGSAWVRIGQWKRPFNRQEIVSDFAQTFTDRANTAGYVGGGRDAGIAIHNDYEKSPAGLEWVVGVFNGFSGAGDAPSLPATCVEGATAPSCTVGSPTTVPSDWGPTVVGRVGWNSPDMKGYSEGDLEGGPLRYAVAIAYKVDLANFAQGEAPSRAENLSHGLEADAALKVQGFDLSVGGYLMKVKAADATYGAMAQAGYFVVPEHGQVAARFAIAPTSGTRKQLEARVAFTWYWEGHRWKWINELGWVVQTGTDSKTMTSDDPDYQLRSCAQLTF